MQNIILNYQWSFDRYYSVDSGGKLIYLFFFVNTKIEITFDYLKLGAKITVKTVHFEGIQYIIVQLATPQIKEHYNEKVQLLFCNNSPKKY